MTTQGQVAELPDHASWGRVIVDQKRVITVAIAMMVLSFGFRELGSWNIPFCLIAGIALGLANHLATEHWLLRVITSGESPTRGQLTRATVIRLSILAVVAIAATVIFWPDGIGVLLGLAIFRLIALVMTTIPLLKELKNP